MAIAHEQDVVLAFRQAVEEELRLVQEGHASSEAILIDGAPLEDNFFRLAHSHAKLQHEVALLRTIILKLVSDPVEIPEEEDLTSLDGSSQTQA
jgi:hypothetical protein